MSNINNLSSSSVIGSSSGDIHHGQCILVGDFFSWCVQYILGLSCILILWIKRLKEVPKRHTIVWFLDVSKQCIGATFGHFLNIYLSHIFAFMTKPHGDTCQGYLILFIGDSSIGVLLNVLLLRVVSTFKFPIIFCPPTHI